MIEFKPEILENNEFAYIAFENENPTGKCVFSLGGYNVSVKDVNCSDDITLEGILRSGLNYAANRGAFLAEIRPEHLCPAFSRLGFSKDKLIVEIPDALESSCCKCGNK